jgi:hypothetical protein
LMDEWFAKWHLGEPDEKERAAGLTPRDRRKKREQVSQASMMAGNIPDYTMQQIKDWLKNHSKSGASSEGKPKLLDLQRKKTRRLPIWQAYSRLYYESKLKEVVEFMWRMKYLKENPDADEDSEPPTMPIPWRNETIAILLEDESAEVKEECKTYAGNNEEPEVELPEEWETDDAVERNRLLDAYRFGKWVAPIVLRLLLDADRD